MPAIFLQFIIIFFYPKKTRGNCRV